MTKTKAHNPAHPLINRFKVVGIASCQIIWAKNMTIATDIIMNDIYLSRRFAGVLYNSSLLSHSCFCFSI